MKKYLDVKGTPESRNTVKFAKKNISNNNIKSQQIRYMIAEKGNFLGLNDVMMKRYYTLSVRCNSSSGLLLKISSSEFLKFVESTSATRELLESMSNDIDQTTMIQLRQRYNLNNNVKKQIQNSNTLHFPFNEMAQKTSPKHKSISQRTLMINVEENTRMPVSLGHQKLMRTI